MTIFMCLFIFDNGMKFGKMREDNVFYQGCMKSEQNAIICGVYMMQLRRGNIWCKSCVRP